MRDETREGQGSGYKLKMDAMDVSAGDGLPAAAAAAADEQDSSTFMIEKARVLMAAAETGLVGSADAVDLSGAESAAVDASAEASVAVLATLHKAIKALSLSLAGQEGSSETLPGELEDTRFLKGLRLGSRDKGILNQYIEMGMWRRISWLNHLLSESIVSELESEEAKTAAAAATGADDGVAEMDEGGEAAGQDLADPETFKSWYMEQYTATFADDLDSVRKQADFGGAADVARLIQSIESGNGTAFALCVSTSWLNHRLCLVCFHCRPWLRHSLVLADCPGIDVLGDIDRALQAAAPPANALESSAMMQ